MNLEQRVLSYNQAFPQYSRYAPLYFSGSYIIGVWILGNSFMNKNDYYGSYPGDLLERINSLFPDISVRNILHVFSGTISKTLGDTIDINPEIKSIYHGDVHNLSDIVPKNKYEIIIADPPYSDEDCNHYGTIMVKRNIVLKECVKTIKDNGFIVWLDQVYPQYTNVDMKLIGTIGVIISTNHRTRMLCIYQKHPFNNEYKEGMF